jgi:K+-transporting ATPase ATPase C chain
MWRHHAREVRAAAVVTLLLALLAGLLFPLTVVGVAQLAFPHQAAGSLTRNAQGQVIGSDLIGQQFTAARYVHPRPSAAGAGYDAATSSGLNLGPTNPDLVRVIAERAAAYRSENGVPDDIELPADAVTTSASGLDPHISPANAYLQVPRVARARHMTEEQVRDIVRRHVHGRVLGFFGEPRVNVLQVNLALDQAQQ